MLANAASRASESKPSQVVHFEDQLTRLMRTVPGINEQQVREMVEMVIL